MKFTIFSFFIVIFANSPIKSLKAQVLSLDKFLCQTKTPLICGHRGGYYPQFAENSLPVFDLINKAMGDSYFILEIDIRESADGVLIVTHDDNLLRTAGLDKSVKEMTFKKLKELKLVNAKGNATHTYMLTFDEVLFWAQDKKVFFMLDNKINKWEKILEMLKLYNMTDRCCLLTFNATAFNEASKIIDKTLISVLVTNYEELVNFRTYKLKHALLMAYVTTNTPEEILNELVKEGNFILSDPREVWNGIITVPEKTYYDNFSNKLHLNILVTDFPIEVNRYFRQK